MAPLQVLSDGIEGRPALVSGFVRDLDTRGKGRLDLLQIRQVRCFATCSATALVTRAPAAC